ncbi:MAG TPA: hypothetical protein DDW27_03100 [Bacteroidales bacterium]|nr:hypothetical protein [Bacteroidales bacterium]
MLSGSLIAQDLFKTSKKLWKPQQDDVYLQEVAKKIPTELPVQSLAVHEGRCFAVIDEKIRILDNNILSLETNAPAGVKRLISRSGDLWALASDGIYRLRNSKWEKIDNREYVDICIHNGILHGATKEEIFRLTDNKFVSIKPEGGYYSSDKTMQMEDGTQIHAAPVRLGPLTRIESYSGTLHLLQPGRLILFDGLTVNRDFIDWGTLPSGKTNDMLSYGSRLFISTARGLAVLRGASLTTIKGIDGLPVESTTCLEKGFDDDIWIGTTKGAVRMLNNDWHYFGADHWLPGDHVNDIAVGKNIVYIATDKGVGIIRYEPYTLLKKASFYERHIEEWGHKRLGFIHTLYKKDGEWVREVSDNDGGHTATYLAAMSYKYAVTGDKTARKEAVEAFNAMIWLERITPVDGFFARSIWSTTGDKDERGREGSGGLPAKWYPTPDGKWFWKGDTSSDEVTAHFYAISLFLDLVAEGKEKEVAKEHLNRIASYILKCGWVLLDMDGKPTRWGRWNPEYLDRPYGYIDRGLNSLEALTFMQTALSVTGDEKFKAGYQQLIDWDYHHNTLRQKNVFPPESIAPWDDNLAFESYYTLFRYTDDPGFRSVFLRSLERTWEVKRMEHIPWFNFAYGAITGNDCEPEQSVKHLREWTLDCTVHNFQNSHRDDLYPENGYTSYEGGKRAISPRESTVMTGSRNATVLDDGAGGNIVKEPTGFLRDYWMGRYHGFIQAPATSDPEFISVNPSKSGNIGAKPYDGPGRPVFY